MTNAIVHSVQIPRSWIGNKEFTTFYNQLMRSAPFSNIASNEVRFQGADNLPRMIQGSGEPEGNVEAPVGSQYFRADGGPSTSIYYKESGTGSTGWVASASVLNDPTLLALAAFNSNGLMAQTAENNFTSREIQGVSGETIVTDGDGVGGNPVVGLDPAYVGQASITTVGTVATGSWQSDLVLQSYTVATVPDATLNSRRMIYVSDESGGAVPAFSDGTNWLRVTDRAVIS